MPLTQPARASHPAAAQIGFTPLRWASLYGHKEAVETLRGAEARDDLFSASARGDAEAVEEMIAGGTSDVTNINRGGETALMWAASNGHAACVRLLLKAKANVDAKDQVRRTPRARALHGSATRHTHAHSAMPAHVRPTRARARAIGGSTAAPRSWARARAATSTRSRS